MTTTVNNGRLRKSLAEQIDRLDTILDGLADALNEAVADAVKEAVGVAVQQAVQGMLVEVLTNPQLLEKVRAAVAPPVRAEPKPVPRAGSGAWKRRLHELAGQAAQALSRGWGQVRGLCGAVADQVSRVAQKVRLCWRVTRWLKVPVLTAGAVGAAVGTAAYIGGPYVAAGTGWLAGFTTTLAVQVGL